MSNMAGEENIVSGDEMQERTNDQEGGNNPDPKPLSETGYFVNPDGTVSSPNEELDLTR